MIERRVDLPMDPRSASFVTTEHKFLEASAGSMPTSARTPDAVSAMLARSRSQFVLGCVDYDNFAGAVLVALQAVEMMLRAFLSGGASKKRTLGRLIRDADAAELLTSDEKGFLTEFALRFRNTLAHPAVPMVLTPGVSEGALYSCHEFIASFVDRHT